MKLKYFGKVDIHTAIYIVAQNEDKYRLLTVDEHRGLELNSFYHWIVYAFDGGHDSKLSGYQGERILFLVENSATILDDGCNLSILPIKDSSIMNFKPTLSRIVDVTKENIHLTEGTPIVTPFIPIFNVEGYEYILLKEDERNYTASFASENAALLAAEEFLRKSFKYDFVMVSKAQSTLQTKFFRTVTEAEEYVAQQCREYMRETVFRKLNFGLNIYGGAYGSVDWDWYNIKLVCFED